MTTKTENGHRPVPYDLEAEQAVLGAAMTPGTPTALTWVIEHLRSEDYYSPAHRTIHEAVVQLAADGQPVTPITVGGHLKANRLLDQVGGLAGLHTVFAACEVAGAVGTYGRIVLGRARLRRLIHVGAQITQLGYEQPDPDKAETQAASLVQALTARESTRIADPAEILAAMAALREHLTAGETVTWGIEELDKLTRGFLPGELVVIASPTSAGKSSLALQLSLRAAESLRALFCSYEMGKAQIGRRALAQLGVPSLDEAMWRFDHDRYEGPREHFKALDFQLLDGTPDLATLLAVIRTRHTARPYDLVVVDYLQLVDVDLGRRTATRQEEVARVSRALKHLAMDLSIPVVALSQLNDAGEVRESKAIEQDAGLLVVLKPDENEELAAKGLVHAEVRKNRDGKRATVDLHFLGGRTRFEDVGSRP